MSVRKKRIAAFLQLAEDELLVERGPRQAAYFCQQYAEKIARAILTDTDVAFGTGRNLGALARGVNQP